jgi:hypothetical protein
MFHVEHISILPAGNLPEITGLASQVYFGLEGTGHFASQVVPFL